MLKFEMKDLRKLVELISDFEKQMLKSYNRAQRDIKGIMAEVDKLGEEERLKKTQERIHELEDQIHGEDDNKAH